MMMVMMMMMMQLPATGCIYKSLLLPEAERHSLFNTHGEQFQLVGVVVLKAGLLYAKLEFYAFQMMMLVRKEKV
ncbi:hypothetical protein T11_15132 [Trichinella zimbabwensis]|uniref:Secreted protein n=1 Tax=Trichinella zimbabwensis TaxID=268475 RepID=A0A0V1HGU2_9BILA|nr:hypothetical protein T11_15132 [Trichinella zimbabwensis]